MFFYGVATVAARSHVGSVDEGGLPHENRRRRCMAAWSAEDLRPRTTAINLGCADRI